MGKEPQLKNLKKLIKTTKHFGFNSNVNGAAKRKWTD
jgi:hypothetical protein